MNDKLKAVKIGTIELATRFLAQRINRLSARMDDWSESDHPRAKDGRFGSKAGSGSAKSAEPTPKTETKPEPKETKKEGTIKETGGSMPAEGTPGTKTVNGRTYKERQKNQSLHEYLASDIDSMPRPESLPYDPPGFFNLFPDTIMAKLDKLVSTKIEEENKQGGENAPKRMLAAYDGLVPKRNPVKVKPIGTHRYEITNDPDDLEFEIVDGNGTFTAMKEMGWKDIPIEIADTYLTPQKQADRQIKRVEQSKQIGEYKGEDRVMSPDETREKLIALYDNAAKIKPKYDKAMQEIAGEFGLPPESVMLAPLKGSARAIEKVELEEKGNANSLKDVVRGTLLFNDYKHLEAAIQQMKKLGSEIGRTRNGLVPGSAPQSVDHYRDVKFNVLIDGVPTEVQMNYPEMLEAKEGAGHKLYEEARTIQGKIQSENRDATPEEDKLLSALNKKQQDVYDAAWEKIMARIGKTDD